MKKLIILLVFCVALLTACARPTAAPTAVPTNAPTVIVSSPTPEPIATATVASATPAPTATASATPIPLRITYMGSSAVWQKSSSFILQFNQAVGSYYATGSAQGLGTTYTCKFDTTNPTNLSCTGAPMPYDTQVYIQLFDSITKTNVYSNMITFARNRAMPAGMVCDSEPQWGGDIPEHQLGWGCFAITCYQNGVVFYGNNNLCLGEWPFEWDFPHPLYYTLLNQN